MSLIGKTEVSKFLDRQMVVKSDEISDKCLADLKEKKLPPHSSLTLDL